MLCGRRASAFGAATQDTGHLTHDRQLLLRHRPAQERGGTRLPEKRLGRHRRQRQAGRRVLLPRHGPHGDPPAAEAHQSRSDLRHHDQRRRRRRIRPGQAVRHGITRASTTTRRSSPLSRRASSHAMPAKWSARSASTRRASASSSRSAIVAASCTGRPPSWRPSSFCAVVRSPAARSAVAAPEAAIAGARIDCDIQAITRKP